MSILKTAEEKKYEISHNIDRLVITSNSDLKNLFHSEHKTYYQRTKNLKMLDNKKIDSKIQNQHPIISNIHNLLD